MHHFLVDASLPGMTAGRIRNHGHLATDVRDVGLGASTDDEIAAHAKANGMCVISGDGDFGDVNRYPPADYNGLVVVQPPRKSTRAIVLNLIEQFLTTPDVVANLSGRLVIVGSRTNTRPAANLDTRQRTTASGQSRGMLAVSKMDFSERKKVAASEHAAQQQKEGRNRDHAGLKGNDRADILQVVGKRAEHQVSKRNPRA